MDENYRSISTDAEKAFNKFQYFYIMKTLKKTPKTLGIERNYHNMKKAISEKPTADIILNVESLKAFPLRSGIPTMPTHTTLLNVVLEVLAREISQEKEMKGIQTGK